MFCSKCGAQIRAGALFCGNCGEKVSEEKVSEEKVSEEKINEEKVNVEPAMKENQKEVQNNSWLEKIKNDKKIQMGITGAVIAVILLIIILVIYNNSKHTINLEEYVSVEFSGYETHGCASVEFDEDTYIADVKKLIRVEDSDDVESLIGDYITLEQLYDVCKCSVDKTSDLSNGDKVTVSFEYDNDSVKKYNFKFKGDDMEFTVEGLEEMKTVDPFEDIEIEFSGIDGSVTAKVINNSKDSFLSNMQYDLSKSEDIHIGDVIKVEVGISEDTAGYNGYQLEQMSKEFTCEKADTYLQKLEQVDEETLKSLQKQTVDILESSIGMDEDFATGEWSYEGLYLLLNKDLEDSWSEQNVLYVVYSTTLSPVEDGESFAPVTVHAPVSYKNILVKADGTLDVDLQEGSLEGPFNEIEDTWAGCDGGYFSGTDMYNAIIKANLADYTYEVSEGLQQYGN